MDKVIQLKHPTGKNAIVMDREKYDMMKKAMLSCIGESGALSHTEMHKAVKSYFQKKKIKFNGSVEWHMEWVKLDLEAHKIIFRENYNDKLKFKINPAKF